MSEYNRLTERGEPYYAFDKCKTCEYGKDGCDKWCDQTVGCFCRLQELEDKIENGTLRELPCKVGDTVYFDTYRHGESIGVQPHKVERVEFVVTTERTFGNVGADIHEWQFGKSVFLTKSEAESELEELQEKQK